MLAFLGLLLLGRLFSKQLRLVVTFGPSPPEDVLIPLVVRLERGTFLTLPLLVAADVGVVAEVEVLLFQKLLDSFELLDCVRVQRRIMFAICIPQCG